MKLLHIDSSALGDQSASRTLTRAIVEQLLSQHPDTEVTYRDLDANPIPHLTAGSLAGKNADEAAMAAETLQSFLDTDVLVIGAPMYNFSVPSTLKAWIDRIAIAGKTFRYTANGPEGLAGGKRVIVASSRGGVYAADAANDHQEAYLRSVFAFMGITEVEFVRAEGLALSPESRETAMNGALGSVPTIRRKAA